MTRNGLLTGIAFLAAAIAFTHAAAINLYLYWMLEWFDSAVHFAGGALIALIALWLIFLSQYVPPREESVRAAVLWSLSAVLAVGVLWEIFEVVAGVSVSEADYALDTAMDLGVDVAGALVASVFYARARLLS